MAKGGGKRGRWLRYDSAPAATPRLGATRRTRPPPPPIGRRTGKLLVSRDGDRYWTVPGTVFLDTEEDERYDRNYIEGRVGPLREVDSPTNPPTPTNLPTFDRWWHQSGHWLYTRPAALDVWLRRGIDGLPDPTEADRRHLKEA